MSQTSVREASPLKIGVMLRGIDGKGGIGIYCQNLMDHLLAIDNVNRYILYYAKEEFLGRYKSFPNVEECYLKAPGRLVWDQLSVTRHARKNEVDVLFNTKLTVPLFTRCKTAMTVHGAGWWIMPQMYKRLDIAYVRVSQPLYCRKADAILSVSQCTTDDYMRILHIPADKVRTVWLAAADSFKPCNSSLELEATRRQYCLPHRFILSVVKYDPRKNVPNLLEAFRLCRQRTDCKLVVIGSGCEKFGEECGLRQKGIADDVTFLGWVDNKQLPALYNLAEFLFFPSVYEEFGIPTVEAMSCGLPVIISKTGALPELAGDAGCLLIQTIRGHG
jgi:glycosyltransferase involved in cell wall biosynthesis